MNLKNYTSSVPVERTVARIEEALAKAGADGILKDYDAGRLCALAFRVKLPTGKPISIRLPANADAVWQTMKRAHQLPRRPVGLGSKRFHRSGARSFYPLRVGWPTNLLRSPEGSRLRRATGGSGVTGFCER